MQAEIPFSQMNARQIFAFNLRRLRVAKKISQEQLADLAGLHRTYISSIERGERNITVETMERLAIALNVEIPIFFSRGYLDDEATSG